MPKVSVIIPVYGVESYIGRCARSLFEQTLDDIEYIFVNDCTKDKSIEVLHNVLAEYPSRKPQVKIINHEKNGGQAATRTTGMKAATGEYIIHCDSDDWADKRMYELLYAKAKETGSDVVVCNHNQVYPNGKIIPTEYNQIGTPHEWLRNFQGSWNCWAKLVKRSIVVEHNIYPFEGYDFSEDRNVVMRVFYYAKSIAIVEIPLYYYDKTRDGAITNKCRTNIKLLKQREDVMLLMDDWFKKVGFDLGDQMLRWKYSMSLLYLYSTPPAWESFKKYLPEIIPYVKKENMNPIMKIAYILASHNCMFPIKLILKIRKS